MTTTQARQLTTAHQRAQWQQAAEAVALSQAAWEALDVADIDATIPLWLEAQLPIVQRGLEASARLAAQYLRAFRTVELGDAGSPVLADDMDAAQVAASLQVTGPVAFKRAIGQGRPPRQASRRAFTQLSGAVVRHVAAGGRRTVDATVRADSQALGWARITAADPCEFCALLASRGPVYGSREVAEGAGLGRRVRGSRTGGDAYHDSCVVGSTPVRGPSVQAAYRRLYEGELLVIGLAGGQEVSITPNHPVLTPRGWVEAGLLREGDEVIQRAHADLASLDVPHEQDVPSLIEDVWRAHSVDGFASMPVAAEDFHGDGVGSQGDVDVVPPYGLLANVLYPALHEPVADPVGAGAGSASVADAFAALGDVGSPGFGLGSAADGVVCGFGASAPLLGGGLGGGHQRSLGLGSPLYSGFAEPFRDNGAGHAVLGGEVEFGGTGPVSLDGALGGRDAAARSAAAGAKFDARGRESGFERLVGYVGRGRRLAQRLAGGVEVAGIRDLRRIHFSGHVYNLSTIEGWYDANSLVVSNCRCTAEPSYGDWTPPPETERWEQIYTEASVPGDLRATLRNMRRALGRT